MSIEHVPLLQIQRELYRLPRGRERFQAYLQTMVQPDGRTLKLPPLVAMNPMGKEHLPTRLDGWLAIDAEGVAARVAAAIATEAGLGPMNLGLVIADDVAGGWTNRHACELAHRFPDDGALKAGWLTAILWASEVPALPTLTTEVRSVIWRAVHVKAHGGAKTLRERLAQEGWVLAKAGCTRDWPGDEGVPTVATISRIRRIIAAHLDSMEPAALIPCLFGDAAAESLGYQPIGLPPNAGFALALHDALGDSSATS